MSEYEDIPVITWMGSERNSIKVLSADVVVACGLGAETVSEVALALKVGKHIILLEWDADSVKFFRKLRAQAVVYQEKSVAKVIGMIHSSLQPGKKLIKNYHHIFGNCQIKRLTFVISQE